MPFGRADPIPRVTTPRPPPRGEAEAVDQAGEEWEGSVEMMVIQSGIQTKLCLSHGLFLSL